MTRDLRRSLAGAGVAMLLLTACTRPENNIGQELLPPDDILSALQTDTVTMSVRMVRDTAIPTDEINPVLCANYSDPALGTVHAGFFTQLRLESASPDFGNPDELIIESVELTLVFDEDYPFPERGWSPGFNIYRMTEFMFLDSTYSANEALSFDNSESLELNPDVTYINDLVPDTADESATMAVTIPLKPEFALELMTAPEASLENNDTFVEFFEGIYVELDDNTEDEHYHFDLTDGLTQIVVNYKEGEDGETQDFAFTVNSSCARFTSISRTYSGFAAPLENDDFIALTDGQAYVHGGAGFGLELTFPYLSLLKTKYPELNINKAELILPTEQTASDLPEHDGMLVRSPNEEGDFDFIGDHNTLINIDGGYEELTNDYRFILTRHIQDLLNDAVPDDRLYILSSNRQNQLLRNLVNGPSYVGSGGDRHMRLVLTFSQ